VCKGRNLSIENRELQTGPAEQSLAQAREAGAPGGQAVLEDGSMFRSVE